MRMMKESREFPGLAQSVRAARTFVLECVSGIEPSSSDAIALMTSELAANSVLHAASSFVVSVELTDAEIRVSVTDEGEGRPEPRDSGPGDQSGRGLHIVAQLSDSWGTRPVSPSGNVVWFTVERQDATEDARGSVASEGSGSSGRSGGTDDRGRCALRRGRAGNPSPVGEERLSANLHGSRRRPRDLPVGTAWRRVANRFP